MKFTLMTVAMVLLMGAQASQACTLQGPDSEAMIQELQTVALGAVQADPKKIDVLIEPLQEYTTSETNSSGTCPDAVHFTEKFAVRYKVDNGLDMVCNAQLTVTKSVPIQENPTVTYSVENLHNARCFR